MSFSTEFYLNRAVFTVAVLVVDLIISFILKKVVDVFFQRIVKTRVTLERSRARTTTLRELFKNIIDVVMFAISALIILSNWGVNIVPILTGASILGLAISFGAQTFIKDLIAGMFIIIEEQYHIGDTIQVDKFQGEVVSISLRMTVLKDKKGSYIYIPNSSITMLVRLKSMNIV